MTQGSDLAPGPLVYSGGEGEAGRIQEVVAWDKKFHRGGVKVQWKHDSTCKKYRVGGEGCVDVIYTCTKQTASGGKYYPDHLPVVGEEFCTNLTCTVNCTTTE
jgi:hypothetical protein